MSSPLLTERKPRPNTARAKRTPRATTVCYFDQSGISLLPVLVICRKSLPVRAIV